MANLPPFKGVTFVNFRKFCKEAFLGVLSTPKQQKTTPRLPSDANGHGPARAQLDLGLITPN
jgi:hypothetical protein